MQQKVMASAVFPFPLIVLLTVYFAVSSALWFTYPVWDGMNSYSFVMYGLEQPFDLLNFPPDGHIAQAAYLPMTIPFLLFGKNYIIYNAWLTGFAAFGIFAFYHLARMVTHYKAGAWECALYTAIFAFHPTILANVIRLSPDGALTLYLLIYWLALWKDKRTIALVFAVLATFSKEISYILLPIPFIFCFLLQPKGAHMTWLRRHAPVFLIPYLMIGIFLFYKMELRHQPAFWAGHGINTSIKSLLPTLHMDEMFLIYLVLISSNFQWLIMLLWVAFLAGAVCKYYPEGRAFTSVKMPCILMFAFLASVFVVTRVTPYANLRYVMETVPFVLLGFFLFYRMPLLLR